MALHEQKAFASRDPATTGINPYFFGVQPNRLFFETYGISECSQVWSRRGLCRLENIRSTDELVSRTFGFARPVGILKSSYVPGSLDAPSSLMIPSGHFHENFPQGDVIVGEKTEIRVPITSGVGPRPSMSVVDMNVLGNMFASFNSNRPRLFVPVFANRTEIQVEGLCVVCPSVENLAQSFKNGTASTSMH